MALQLWRETVKGKTNTTVQAFKQISRVLQETLMCARANIEQIRVVLTFFAQCQCWTGASRSWWRKWAQSGSWTLWPSLCTLWRCAGAVHHGPGPAGDIKTNTVLAEQQSREWPFLDTNLDLLECKYFLALWSSFENHCEAQLEEQD